MVAGEILEEIISSELHGLCGTCTNYEDCTYRRATEKIIIQCELFDLPALKQHRDAAEAGNEIKGLCANCYKAPLCNLPKAAHGVWHCEEYE